MRGSLDAAEIFPPAPQSPEVEPDLKVSIILSPCFSLLPFACLVDSLRFAADTADYSRRIYCHWQVIAPELKPIKASCGIDVNPEQTLDQVNSSDYLIVIGGRLPLSMDVSEETLHFLQQEHSCGRKIIGICTGSFILARAGLLNGYHCAVNDQHLHQMQQLYPQVKSTSKINFLEDNGVITCNGGTSALDLVFSLIETHCGKARAIKALSGLVLDHRHQEYYAVDRPYGHLLSCGNWQVEQAVALMQRNLSEPLSIAKLAVQLNTTTRALNRAFKKHTNDSPSVISRNMRLALGHWLLTNTARSITQISLECGFSDAPHFSRLFKQVYSVPPGRARSARI